MAGRNSKSPIEVAVVGVGRMGQHHARIYHSLDGARLAAVVDPQADLAQATAKQFGCIACSNLEVLLKRCPLLRAVSVAAPTHVHVPLTQSLIRHGIACLVEKPLAPTIEDARQLLEVAQSRDVVVQVGHTERFNPAVRAVEAMNITPRYMEVHRVSPMTFRSLDVGVVMDMMIHDLDIVLMLADTNLKRVDATGVAVLGEHEDVANARLVFDSGCVASLTASRLAMRTDRKLRIFSEDAYVTLDYQKRSGLVLRKSGHIETLQSVRRQLKAGEDLTDLDYSQMLNMEQLTMEIPEGQDDPLTAQLLSFLDAVREGRPPAVDAQAGYAAVEAAQRVIEAIRAHRWEGLAPGRV